MIIDGLLFVIQGVVNILLSPLAVINFGIDFLSSIPVVANFLSVIVYLLPWDNLLPLMIILVVLFGFRIGIATIKTLWALLPLV